MSEQAQGDSQAVSWTTVEKDGLKNDLQTMANMLMAHDQYIFQLIAAVNVLQDKLIETSVFTEDSLKESIEKETERMKAEFMESVTKKTKPPEANKGG